MDHDQTIHAALEALEAQIATLKSLLGPGAARAEPDEDAEEEPEAMPPPNESARGRRARHREKASRVIRREMAKGKETDYALD